MFVPSSRCISNSASLYWSPWIAFFHFTFSPMVLLGLELPPPLHFFPTCLTKQFSPTISKWPIGLWSPMLVRCQYIIQRRWSSKSVCVTSMCELVEMLLAHRNANCTTIPSPATASEIGLATVHFSQWRKWSYTEMHTLFTNLVMFSTLLLMCTQSVCLYVTVNHWF